MNVHFTNARNLLARAALPDRTLGGFVNAALDGSGQTKRLPSTLKGAGQDLFEVVTLPPRAVLALGKGVVSLFQR